MLMIKRPPALAALLLAAVCPLSRISPAIAAEDKFFDSDGVKIRYIAEGAGEPVLLIHGFAGSIHLQWGPSGVLKSLGQEYRVIAYDNRGHGLSGKPHDPDKYGGEMVNDALRLLDHLELPRAHIVGYSLGAFIAGKLLVDHPERVLTATLGGGGWAKANDVRAEFINDVISSLEQGNGIAPLLVKLTPEGQPKPTDFQLRVANRAFGLCNDQTALAGVMRGMKQFAVTEEQLKANRVPTLAVIGDKDPLKVTVDEMAEVMPNLEVAVIKDAGHVRAFRRPEFVHELKSFLSRHSPPTKP